MNETLESTSPFGIHIALATIPQNQEQQFLESIKNDFYNGYLENCKNNCKKDEFHEKYWHHELDKKNEISILYNPVRYYLLGNYDIAYISLIDNFKFAHRLFEPTHDSGDTNDFVFNTHTLQNFCGIPNNTEVELRDFFYENLRNETQFQKYFIGICNLKLNNGLLVGNGLDFIKSVENYVLGLVKKNKTLFKDDDIKIIVMQSYSWFEISLLIFSNHIDDISECIKLLRRSAIKDLDNHESIIENSLYKSLKPDNEFIQIQDTNIFADTHTFIGLHSDLIEKNINDDYVNKFIKEDIKLLTEIEWQIKPGHMHLLKNLINRDENLKSLFVEHSKLMITGKSDYLIEESSQSIVNNLHLLRYIIQNKDNRLFDHVRKIRTKILFEPKNEEDKNLKDRSVSNLASYLTKLAIKNSDISDINNKLKALKISRQFRLKILKIFSNYNNGIQDIILFNLFLDFKVFIDNLIKIIDEEYNKWINSKDGDCLSPTEININSLEKTLVKWLDVFQEGYDIRILNGYQFEDIIDFDLDFNSSIEQLLSAYSTVSYEIGDLFYNNKLKKSHEKKPKAKYSKYTEGEELSQFNDKAVEFGPIIQLNYKDTVANYLSINYSVHHLTSPEFVFSTITKEILNSLKHDNDRLKEFTFKYNNNLRNLCSEIDSNYLNDMIASRLIDPNYFINDALRFLINFNLDFELFYYWFWAYNFQNTSLYDKSGLFNEISFKQELFRILFLKKLYGFNEVKDVCPLPELYTYWDRHYKEITKAVNVYYNKLKENGYLDDITLIVFYFTNDIFESELSDSDITKSQDGNDIQANTVHARKIKALFTLTSRLPQDLKELRHVYINNFNKRLEIFDKLPYSDNEDTVNDILKLQQFIFHYLLKIYNLNKKKVSLLRRDWQTGKVLNCFLINNDDDHIYSIDQTGGLFFDNMSKLNEYFKLSSKSINFILDFSLKRKKNFIIKKISSVDER